MLDVIVKALKEQRCVIFFGSGISRDSGLPTSTELIKDILDLPETEQITEFDLARIAQIQRFRHINNTQWLHNRLINLLTGSEKKPNDLHKLLVMLKSKYYITTNYDRLFDDVLQEYIGVKDLSRIVKDEDISKYSDVLYIKLHGDIFDGKSIVLTYDDYETKFDNNPNLLHLLFSIFSQNLVLFVGYSLKDPNILSIVRKIAQKGDSYAKGMYIILRDANDDDLTFFKSLNVKVIPLIAPKEVSTGDALKKMLMEIWHKTLTYDIYLNMKPKQPAYEVKLALAINRYHQGEYNNAELIFDELIKDKNAVEVWKKSPDTFAQFTYFYLKNLDKQNKWDELLIAKDEISSQLNKYSKLYPASISQVIKNSVNISLGLSMMRGGRYLESYEYIKNVVEEEMLNISDNKDFDLLHADRNTILSVSCLCLSIYNKDEKKLEESQNFINTSLNIFQKYSYFGGSNDIHYLGRFFGTNSFLMIALHRNNLIKYDEDFENKLLEYSNLSHNSKDRVPYGKLAGRYCEAISNYYIGVQSSEKYILIEKSVNLLTHCLNDNEITLSSLDKCKIFKALSVIFQTLNNVSKSEEYAKLFLAEVQNLYKLGSLKEVVENENWIFTPLN